MTAIFDMAGMACISLGVALFIAGAAGVLRLPDALSRFHALTKIDNLALGCICVGLALMARDLASLGMLTLIWIMALVSGAVAAQLVAGSQAGQR